MQPLLRVIGVADALAEVATGAVHHAPSLVYPPHDFLHLDVKLLEVADGGHVALRLVPATANLLYLRVAIEEPRNLVDVGRRLDRERHFNTTTG